MHNPPICNADGSWVKSNVQKANRFAQQLTETFQANTGENGVEWENIIQEGNAIRLNTPKKVTIGREGENINPRKVRGLDSITGELYKQLQRKELIKLTYLINGFRWDSGRGKTD